MANIVSDSSVEFNEICRLRGGLKEIQIRLRAEIEEQKSWLQCFILCVSKTC